MAAVVLGAKAPQFDLPGTDGKNHSLAALAESDVSVVVFTCNHCPYAKAWEDRVLKLGRDYSLRGVAMVAISSNDAVKFPDDGFEEMEKRARAKRYPIPYLYDESQEVARAYGAQRTPEVFVFDSKRELRYHGKVDDNEDEAKVKQHYLRDALDAVLAGKTPPVADTEPAGCTIKWK